MSYTKLPTMKRLVLSKEAIQIIQNDSVLLARLETWGYTAEWLAEGLAKQQVAEQLMADRSVSYGVGIAATASVIDVEKEVRAFLALHRNMVRMTLKEQPGLAEQLRVQGALDGNREQMLVKARHFYGKIQELPEVQALLNAAGLTAAVVVERLGRVEELAAAMQEQQHKRALATVATREREVAMRDLDDWMVVLLSTVRTVFKREPEQIRKLGLPV